MGAANLKSLLLFLTTPLLFSSDPASPKYGKHYTQQQVIDLFAPHDDSINAVHDWLAQNGVPKHRARLSKSKTWVDFTTTVGHLEKLLQAKYHVYSHINGKDQQITSEKYTVPGVVSDHVDFIAPAMTFSSGRATGAAQRKRLNKTGGKVKTLQANVVQQLQNDPSMTPLLPRASEYTCIRC